MFCVVSAGFGSAESTIGGGVTINKNKTNFILCKNKGFIELMTFQS